MTTEYDRRLTLCAKAVGRVTKKLGFSWNIAEDYQGIEISIPTEVGRGLVVVLMDTGHGPLYPKFITFTIHGYIDHRFNSKLRVSGGGLEPSTNKFLPTQISQVWLRQAISKAAKKLQILCTAKNMDNIKKEALAQRHQAINSSSVARHQTTIFTIT